MEGELVMAVFEGGWWPGRITFVYGEADGGGVAVNFDDGDYAPRLAACDVAPRSAFICRADAAAGSAGGGGDDDGDDDGRADHTDDGLDDGDGADNGHGDGRGGGRRRRRRRRSSLFARATPEDKLLAGLGLAPPPADRAPGGAIGEYFHKPRPPPPPAAAERAALQ
jgi:hypothetical protein